MRSYLVLDIETVPDPKLAWDAAREGFPPAPYHEVVALGLLWLDEELGLKRLGVCGEGQDVGGKPAPEATVLEEFARFVGHRHPHIITYNGRSFDLPVLVNRCLCHGVPFRAYYSDRDYRYRFSDLGHIDLADVLTDHGAARKPRLDSLTQLIGLPGKMDVDGSMVGKMYEEGRIEEIRTYCLHDVVQTAFLFLRVELLRGRLDRARYREKATALWDALAEDERARPVLELSDRRRLLLEDASGVDVAAGETHPTETHEGKPEEARAAVHASVTVAESVTVLATKGEGESE